MQHYQDTVINYEIQTSRTQRSRVTRRKWNMHEFRLVAAAAADVVGDNYDDNYHQRRLWLACVSEGTVRKDY
jgi:hypothetical protein